MAWKYNPFTDELDYYNDSTSSALDVVDDGTYFIVSFNSVALFKVRKSDGQFIVKGGFDTDGWTGDTGTGTDISCTDDGTNWVVKAGTTTLFKVRKSDGQFIVKGGFDSDGW